MTAIAYRDGVMAADSQVNWGQTAMGRIQKIARIPGGGLVATTGAAEIGWRFKEWVIAGAVEPHGLPAKSTDDEGWDALMVDKDGQAWYMNATGRFPITSPFVAIGSGMDFMLAAMAMGASAERAVEVACQFESKCGGPIQVERLEQPR